MILLTSTTDALQLNTTPAADIDVHASYMDHTTSSDDVVGGRQNTAITTASTPDIVDPPSSGVVRNVKTLHIRNKDSADSCTVTVIFDQNGSGFQLHSVLLAPGQMLSYVDGIGFFTYESGKVDVMLACAGDVINATTSFADITGLTYPVESGKRYVFLAHLIHVNNATTTGSRFGVNGPTMTYVIAATIDTVTVSVTASAHSAGAVTALDTAVTAQTTGATSNRLAIVSGIIEPSANGTFAMRCASEVAVAAGLTVRRGSWVQLREL